MPFKFKTREDLNSDIESISIELDIKHVKPIIVTTIYRPPHSLVEWFDRAEKLVSEIDFENNECILAGDMNCDMLDTRGNDTRHIKRIYGTYQFKQMITEVTGGPADLSVDTGQGLNAPKAQVRGHVTRRQPK